jgi:phytoene dehydrogenase-like protein
VAFYHDLGEAAGAPGAWGFVRGGMGSVTAALRAAAEAAGARVTTEAPVERVLVEDGRATGVALAGDGREVTARAVLSGADPLRTARLAGAPAPDGWRQAGPTVKVMLLLDGLPEFPAWPGREPWAGAIDIGFTLDDLARAAAGARAGRPAAAPWIEAACQTATDPTLVPDGRHVLCGHAGELIPHDPHFYMYNHTLVGATLGSYPRDEMRRIHAETQAALIGLLAAGKYRPTVERCVRFEEVPQALTDLAARRTMGRVVVRIAS